MVEGTSDVVPVAVAAAEPASASSDLDHQEKLKEAEQARKPAASAPPLSYKGNPGEPGFESRVSIVKSVMAHPVEHYLKKGKRTETFKKVTATLNTSSLFAGQLKWEQVRDKFKEGEDEATAITIQGEEAWIKLRQNGNQPLPHC